MAREDDVGKSAESTVGGMDALQRVDGSNGRFGHDSDSGFVAHRDARSAQEDLAAILGAIADPFVVYDANWCVRYVNQAAALAMGVAKAVSPESLVGRNLWTLYPDLPGTGFEREMRRCQSDRVPVTFEQYYAGNGRWSELRCYPMPDGGVAILWKDMTDQKMLDERLHYLTKASDILASSLDYRTTVTQVAQLLVPQLADWCGVQLLNHQGRIEQIAVAHVDPEKIEWAWELNRRYPVDMTTSTGVPNVLRTGRAERYVDIPDELLQAGAVDADHLRILRELGMKSVLIVPLTARGRVIGVMSLIAAESGRRYTDAEESLALELAERAAIAIDNSRLFTETSEARVALDESIEEFEALNEELRQTNDELEAKTQLANEAREEAESANRAKADFLATMSHELRTPLNAIAGYADLLLLGVRGELTQEQQRDVERLKRSGQHLLALINDVLNFAKLEAGKVDFRIEETRLTDVLESLDDMIRPQLEGKSLRYMPHGCDSELTVRADGEKIRQVLLNLLANATKFTEPGGAVTVSCDADETSVQISVHDTGRGIASDRLQRIFEPFVQVDRHLTPSSQQGVGLGLAISRDLALAMGGELSVVSAVGEGSTFTLRLPRE